MRTAQELTLEGLTVTTMPLGYEQAEDLLPDIGQLVALVLERAAGALASLPEGVASLKSMDVSVLARMLGPVLASVADKLGGGTLKRLAPLLLATTQVIMSDETGKKARYELMKSGDRAAVFNEHPEAYFSILFFAGKVTFARFFPASVLAAGLTKLA